MAWLLGAVEAGCGSSAKGPGGGASGPCMAGLSGAAVLATATAACQSCVKGACAPQMTACASDCDCNARQGSAIACLGVLTPASTAEVVTGCVSGLAGSSNAPLVDLGTCLSSCVGPCNGSPNGGPSGGPTTDGGPARDAGSPVDAPAEAPPPRPDAMPDVARRPDAAPEVKVDTAPEARPDAGSPVDAPAEAPPPPPDASGGEDSAAPPPDADDSDAAGLD